MKFMKALDIIAFAILIIGGLNWGLVGFWNINVIGLIFEGDMTLVSRIVYATVGVSALYTLLEAKMLVERWTHGIEAHAHA
jgi:uncharacterized membrane protein YuzA (DUF378 family)